MDTNSNLSPNQYFEIDRTVDEDEFREVLTICEVCAKIGMSREADCTCVCAIKHCADTEDIRLHHHEIAWLAYRKLYQTLPDIEDVVV